MAKDRTTNATGDQPNVESSAERAATRRESPRKQPRKIATATTASDAGVPSRAAQDPKRTKKQPKAKPAQQTERDPATSEKSATTAHRTSGPHFAMTTQRAAEAKERALVRLASIPEAEARVDRLSGVDSWGRSERMRSIARAAYDPLYRYWFRTTWEGLDKIPSQGGALLVANHAGAIPSDAPVIMHGIEKELGRPVYGLAENLFRTMPIVGTMWSRLGGVNAHPDNALRLLRDERQLVLVFPEGVKGTSKLHKHRYQLARFGRGGFVEIAMRAGVPIVPIAVVGNEEANPSFAQINWLARRFGLPYFPLTPQMLLMGPAGAAIPLPAVFKLRVLDPISFDVPPGRDRYSRSMIMHQSEAIRDAIQEHVNDLVANRRHVYWN